MVADLKGQSIAIVGLPLGLKPGEYHIAGHYGSAKTPLIKKFFTVSDKQYTTQHINIKNKRKVNPLKQDMARIGKEQVRKRKAANFRDDTVADLDFVQPVQI